MLGALLEAQLRDVRSQRMSDVAPISSKKRRRRRKRKSAPTNAQAEDSRGDNSDLDQLFSES